MKKRRELESDGRGCKYVQSWTVLEPEVGRREAATFSVIRHVQLFTLHASRANLDQSARSTINCVRHEGAFGRNDRSQSLTHTDCGGFVTNHPDSKLRQEAIVSRAFDESLVNLRLVPVFTGHHFGNGAVPVDGDVMAFVAV
ncbi:MAG TPA: hypothetical protein VLT36_21775 [Candidatus Dormibacteraeota bacterium]|nr:hypothetical protein [Candidatus Dormibacteraeota bacterium]